MNHVQIRDTLVAALEAGWTHSPTVPIVYENTTEVDLENGPDAFVRACIHFDGADQANIAVQPFTRHYGTLELTFLLKETLGVRTLLGYVDEVAAFLEYKNLSGVHVQSASASKGARLPGWFSQSVDFSFFSDSNT